MIVHRATIKVKVGCMDKIVELTKAEFARSGDAHKWRLYTFKLGSYDILAYEVEFEDLAELDKFWTTWYATPEAAEYFKKIVGLREAGGGEEVWNLVE